LVFVLPLIAVGAWAPAARPVPAPTAPIDEWIDQLGHPDPARQRAARFKLQRHGEPALAKLRHAAKQHPQPLVRSRAAEVAECIGRGEIMAIGTGTGYWFNRIAFTPDSRCAVVTGGAVILMDLLEGKEVRRDLELQFARRGLALSPSGKQFATGHQGDRLVRIGDVATGKVTQTLAGHQNGVHAVAFSPDGNRLVSGGIDNSLRLWDLKAGKEIRKFPGITDQVCSVDFSGDGKRVLSGHGGPGSGFLVRLWDCDTGKEIAGYKVHSGDVMAVFFLPDGTTVVSASQDGSAVVWDVDRGKEIRRMKHEGGIHGAARSPDSKRLLTAGFGDKTVRLWELASGRELKSFVGHDGAALGVAFSPDGLFALSCDARATVRLWCLPR
jgi:WD40 repeat protein